MKSLNIKKKRTVKKYIFIIVGALFLLAIALAVYVFALKGELLGFSVDKDGTSDGTINTKPPTKEQKKAGEDTKKKTTSQETSKPGANPDEKIPSTPSSGQASTKSNIAMIITAANQNGVTFQVRTLIQAVVSSGICTLSLSKQGSVTVTKQVGVQPQSSSSTCKGFDIPASELSSGTWQLNIIFENETMKGSATQAVVIQ